MREIAYQNVGFFLGFFQRPIANAPNRFSPEICQTTWFRARICAFRG